MPLLSSTGTTLRQGLADYMRENYRGTTTAGGAAGGGTFIDTTDRIEQNDFFNTWWALITSGTYSGQLRQVSDFVQSTGTVTPLTAYGGTIATSVTYEILRYHPVNGFRWAINQALNEIFPALRVSLINEDLVTGNALPNGSFEDFIASTTLPDKWALVGAGATSAKDTSNQRYGLACVSLTRAGTDCYVHCSEVQWPALLDLGGETVWFECWVKASVASRARIGVSVDGGTPTYSSYHTGGGDYELLRVEKAITDSPKNISFRCYVDTGNTTAYFDYARVLSTRISTYLLPAAFKHQGPQRCSVQIYGTGHGDEDPCDDLGESYGFQEWPHFKTMYDQDQGYWLLRFTTLPPTGYKIRLEGQEYITALTADTDTVPLDGPQLNLLYPLAAYRLYSSLALDAKGSTKQDFLDKAQAAYRDYQLLKPRLAQPRISPQADHGNWRG